MKDINLNFNYKVHPGEILREYIEDSGLSKTQIVKVSGISKTLLYNILKEKSRITIETAIKLEKVFSFDASFWCNLQIIYDKSSNKDM